MEEARLDVGAPAAVGGGRFRRARGVLLEVRPLPMAAALCIALLGSLWAGRPLLPVSPPLGWLLVSVFFGLLTAHLMDSFVDVVKRGDRTPPDFPLLFRDSTGLIKDREYVVLTAGAAAVSAGAVVPLVLGGAGMPTLLLALALVIAIFYAPALDRTMVGVTLGYPAGACLVLTASYLAAGGALDSRFAWLFGSLLCALVGIKVRADVIDALSDAAISKRTVAARFGARGATRAGYGLATAGLLASAAAPLLFAAPALFALPPLGAAAAFGATRSLNDMQASLWMSHAMLAALVLEVVVLAV